MPEWTRGACPGCEHPSAYAVHAGGGFICHRCGISGRGDSLYTEPDPHESARRVASACAVVDCGAEISFDDPAGRYLASRGLRLPPIGSELLFVSSLRHPSGVSLPAMVARVRDVDGRTVGAHRTYLTDDGFKADVDPVRAFLGVTKGAAFKTGGDRRMRCVHLCEGIEDALAIFSMTNFWTWACLSAGGLESVILPGGVDAVISPDSDDVGRRSAARLRARLEGEGRRVRIEASCAKDPAEQWMSVAGGVV